MDTYSQDSAHRTNGPTHAVLRAPTREEKVTHRRWARAVLAFYCSLLVLGGIAVQASRSSVNSNDTVARAFMREVP